MYLPNLYRLIVCVAAAIAVTTARADERSAESDQQLKFFESRIRPLLIDRCYECHADTKSEGGLRLDVAETIRDGGDSGPVVVPGDPEASLLVSAIRYRDLEMPPDDPLSTSQQQDIEAWIQQGAVWPVEQSISDPVESEAWWAAEPIDPGPSPASTTPVESPTAIDGYIDARLHEQGLCRGPEADKEKQIRRLSYDLLGLPASPESIREFVADDSPVAYQRLVDRMFADPAYGERMARLWLDLVRYAESDGWRADAFRPQAWRYRDFVTDAFNSKMPYDRFVALQLAGDEIAPADDRAVAAVGFLRLGIYEYNQRDAEGQWQNIAEEMTDVAADVFLATGLACAKCHDHKFDPIPRTDYFHFRSVFEPVLFVDRKAVPNHDESTKAKIARLIAELRQVEADSVRQVRQYTVDRFPLVAQAMYYKSSAERNSYEHQIAYMIDRQVFDEGLSGTKLQGKIGKERFAKWQAIRKQLQELDADPYAPATWMTVADAPGPIRPTQIPGRSSGKTFLPAVPTVFGGQELVATPPNDAPTSSGRRSELARWITSAENPITARVIVNRLWQYHFGTGIVSSPNDFGRLGDRPSHPRLLDHLARRLIDSGWDLQAIQREIVGSAAYRQAAVNSTATAARQIDPDNRLLWHKSVRRLDAEQFRDTLLVVMDSLIDQVGGPSIAGTGGRRSLYLRRYRNRVDDMLGALDAPPGIVGTAKRDQTTTAPQALMMLNNERMISVSQGFAARVRRDVDGRVEDANEFVRRAHQLLTGMEPTDKTIEMLSPVVNQGNSGEVDVCHVLLNSNAFLYVD